MFNFIRKIRLGNLLIASFLLLLIPLGYSNISAQNGITQMDSSAKLMEKQSVQTEDVGQLRFLIQTRRILVYQLIYFEDKTKIAKLSENFEQISNTLDQLKKDGAPVRLIDDISSNIDSYEAMISPIFSNYRDRVFVKKQVDKAVITGAELTASTETLAKAIDNNMRISITKFDNTEQSTLTTSKNVMMLALIFAVLLIVLMQRSIIIPLRRSFSGISDASNELMGSSDSLSNNANTMSQTTMQITSAITEVANGAVNQSDSVSRASSLVGQVSSAIDQVSSSAQNQVSQISEMMAEMNRLVESINEVSDSANVVSNVVNSASEIAAKGKNTVDETVQGMERIKETVLSSAEKIRELGDKSQQIGEIIEVIDDIAEQTNLLALNAAIEAARAGEHGRGFAVVADEVRKLAERSARATGEIADLIKGIQSETMEAVEAMENGTMKVEEGSRLAVNAGNAIAEIMGSVKEIVEQITQVSRNAERMAEASDRVSGAIETIASISQETSASAEEVASSTNQIVDIIDSVAASSNESAASAEQVSASVQEQSSSIHEISSRAQHISAMAEELDKLVVGFNL
jgi:methyl-accepting chemotaxis protein